MGIEGLNNTAGIAMFQILQSEQTGFPSMCVRSWRRRSALWVKIFWQAMQEYGWFMCSETWDWLEKRFPQCEQQNGFPPVWIFSWTRTLRFVGKMTLHSAQ